MMIVMNMTIANNKRIDINNETFIKLRENLSSFEKEARFISDLKCYLINGEDIMDYPLASVVYRGEDYIVRYEDLSLRIKIKDGIIVDLGYE